MGEKEVSPVNSRVESKNPHTLYKRKHKKRNKPTNVQPKKKKRK